MVDEEQKTYKATNTAKTAKFDCLEDAFANPTTVQNCPAAVPMSMLKALGVSSAVRKGLKEIEGTGSLGTAAEAKRARANTTARGSGYGLGE
eukprot:11819450-Heterocapsa_arctica.AAC.1